MDSGGLSDFLQQIPTGLIILFCGSGILLLIVTGYIISNRSRRARKAVPPANFVSEYDDGGDLPDLDVLASTEEAVPPALASAAVPVASSSPPRPTGTFSVALTEGETIDVVEVLSLVRSVDDGSLIIRIGDKAYRNPPAVADAEFKRQFNNAMRDLTRAQKPVEIQAQVIRN